MQAMVTLTANDSCPEMLAAIRRGPMSPPTTDEMIEYLLARKRRDQERPPYEHYSLEHVLSFQRRVKALKDQFFKRGESTPLGKVQDYWDRTEAQMRGALHAHILVWFLRRVPNVGGAHRFITSPGRLPGRNLGSGHAHRWSRRCRRATTRRTRYTIMLTSGGWSRRWFALMCLALNTEASTMRSCESQVSLVISRRASISTHALLCIA